MALVVTPQFWPPPRASLAVKGNGAIRLRPRLRPHALIAKGKQLLGSSSGTAAVVWCGERDYFELNYPFIHFTNTLMIIFTNFT